jgi:AraC-like DNA-binding protein
MQVASEMLKRRNLNMAAIASEIGYESEAAFSRSFKRMMGVTPSAWRQGVRGERTSGPAESDGMQHTNHS